MEGPWNSGEEWDRVDDVAGAIPMDGGDGTASVGLDEEDLAVMTQLSVRTLSNPAVNPMTGADLGAGKGAGRTSKGDMGGADSAADASVMADKIAKETQAKVKERAKAE
jgi:Mn-containing catalase